MNVNLIVPKRGKIQIKGQPQLIREIAACIKSAEQLGLPIDITVSVPLSVAERFRRETIDIGDLVEVRTKRVPRAARKTGPQPGLNLKRLQTAMSKPGFKASAYAKRARVSQQTVYRWVSHLKSQK